MATKKITFGPKDFIKGKKSYILANLGALYVLLTAFNIISVTEPQDMAIKGMFVALFGMTLRAGMNK